MKKIILIGLLVTFLITSCTITQEFHFNKDFSGTARLSVDMAMLIGMMKVKTNMIYQRVMVNVER